MSNEDFWKLAVAAGLYPPDQCQTLNTQFASLPGAEQASAAQLAEWLIGAGKLTRYQAATLLAGRAGPFVLGDYLLEDRVDTGRLTGLFRARHIASRRRVLLYFLPAIPHPEHWAELVRRAQTVIAVKDPRVSKLYQLVNLANYRFLVLEDLQGRSLAEQSRVARAGAAEACRIVREIALALAPLHAAGIVHGELRPDNVWIEPSGNLKLLQFPLAGDLLNTQQRNWLADGAAERAAADYAAPELGQPGRAPDVLTDVYALGCILYELLAGQPPFAGGSATEKLARHATQPIVSLDQAAGVSGDLAKVVTYAMAKNPRLRHQSATALAEALAPLTHAPAAPEPARVAATQATREPEAERAPDPLDFSSFKIQSDHKAGVDPLRRARRRQRGPAIVIGVLIALCGVGVAVAWKTGALEPSPPKIASTQPAPAPAVPIETPVVPEPTKTGSKTGAKDSPSGQPKIDPVDDDGHTLWASPTDGAPLTLQYLPAGSQLFLVLRPAEILANDEGVKMLSALGPAGAAARASLEKITGVSLEDMEQLSIGFYSPENSPPQPGFVVRLREAQAEEKLLEAWGKPKLVKKEKPYYRGPEWAYYVPPAENGKVFAVAAPAAIEAILEVDTPPLRREMEQLVKASDSRRHFTLLVTPSYPLTDGTSLLAGNLQKLRGPITSFLGEGVQAALLSFHLDDDFYIELRTGGTLDTPPAQRAQDMQRRLAALREQVEQYLSTVPLQPYGKAVLLRLPRMLEALNEYSRAGQQDNHAVVCCYLPAHAGHNLAIGLDLALDEQPGHSAPGPTATTQKKSSPREALQRKISLSFPKETLENCLNLVAQEIETEIVILGSDLQLDGITKNQSLTLDERNRTAAEILQTVMAKANPDGKLVYVIKPRQPGGEEIIFITTRSAAQKRGDSIPPELDRQSADGKKK